MNPSPKTPSLLEAAKDMLVHIVDQNGACEHDPVDQTCGQCQARSAITSAESSLNDQGEGKYGVPLCWGGGDDAEEEAERIVGQMGPFHDSEWKCKDPRGMVRAVAQAIRTARSSTGECNGSTPKGATP